MHALAHADRVIPLYSKTFMEFIAPNTRSHDGGFSTNVDALADIEICDFGSNNGLTIAKERFDASVVGKSCAIKSSGAKNHHGMTSIIYLSIEVLNSTKNNLGI